MLCVNPSLYYLLGWISMNVNIILGQDSVAVIYAGHQHMPPVWGKWKPLLKHKLVPKLVCSTELWQE